MRLSWWPWQKQIGWKEIGEDFIRFTLLKTPWFRVYLHRLVAPQWHPKCHDHPWDFISFVIWPGYVEEHDNVMEWRGPGSVLKRPAEWQHNVITLEDAVSWSIIVTGPKRRAWGFTETCNEG